MGKLSWNPDYVPGEFDKIREGKNEMKPGTRLEWGLYFLWVLTLVWALLASILWANRASALETLPTNQITKQKTGFDSVTIAPGSGGCTGGRFFSASRSEGLTIYMDYGCNNYNNQTFITVNNNQTSGGVSWWFNNGPDGQYGRNCGGDCNSGHENIIRGSVNATELAGDWLDLEILVQTRNAPWDPLINHRWRVLSKKDGTVAYLVSIGDYYTARNGQIYWVSHNGTDFVYRRMNATQDGWDDTGTLGFPVNYQYPATVPRCVETSAYTGVNEPVCFYRGVDNAPYSIFLFGNVTALWKMDTGEMTGGGWTNYVCYWLPGCEGSAQPAIEAIANMRPFGIVEPNTDNLAVLWDKWPNTPQFGAITTANLSVAGFYENEDGFIGLSGFVNPKMYFTRNDGTFAIHDLACVQPGFENCGAYNGGFACQSANGSVPSAPTPTIACNAPLEVPPYYYDPNYSGSGTTGGTGSTGGGNCTGSGCIGTGSGAGAVSGFSDFIDYVTNCDDNRDGSVSLTEGITCPVFAIGRFFKGFFDRISAGWAGTWSLLEELMKVGTKTETSGTGGLFGFDFDFIETANAESGGLHIDNPMATAFKNSIENNVASDDIFQKIRRYVIASLYLLAIVVIIGLFFSLRRKK